MLPKFFKLQPRLKNMPTLEEFAEAHGVEFSSCDPAWGGVWKYSNRPGISYAGYKTKKAAALAWCEEVYGTSLTKAIYTALSKGN